MPRHFRLAAVFLPLLAAPALAGTPPVQPAVRPQVQPPAAAFPAASLPRNVALGETQAAPTPDQDLSAPNPPPPAVQFKPAVLAFSQPFQGNGYTYGSSAHGYADRGPDPVYGVVFQVLVPQ